MKSICGLLATVALLGCSSPPTPAAEAEMALNFHRDNRETLGQLVSVAKQGPIPARIGPDEPFEGCPDQECIERGSRLLTLLDEMDAILLDVNEQCHRAPKCSISILIDRHGIAVSGSGTELIYDEAPSWGSFIIHPLKDAPHWFYQHLGD
jgi:hypothetical protein